MLEIYYDSITYSDFLQTVSRNFKARVSDGFLSLPSHIGVGYMKAIMLPCGISVMVSDCKFREDVVLHRNSCQDEYYILQFNEAVESPTLYSTPRADAYNMLKQMVLLTHTGVTSRYFIPAQTRLLSYRILFQRKHLLQFLSDEVIDRVFSKYFSGFVQSGAIDPLDVEYRSLLKELQRDTITHPLAMNFMQNRTLLLMEKFLTKLDVQEAPSADKSRFTDNEIVRLMKIESMLVNDFSVTPPNISYLSRLCAMSPTKLKADFKRLYGMPIYEYFQKNRMQRAKALLLEGKHSIKEVGVKVGYTNLSHFAGSFKKEFGMLPSEFIARDGALAI
ncbi:MAG TPA: helix-turn-helix transcriptional regulator [Chitinophagaceae bacterium]